MSKHSKIQNNLKHIEWTIREALSAISEAKYDSTCSIQHEIALEQTISILRYGLEIMGVNGVFDPKKKIAFKNENERKFFRSPPRENKKRNITKIKTKGNSLNLLRVCHGGKCYNVEK